MFTAAPDPEAVAVHGRSQTRDDLTFSFSDAESEVAAVRTALTRLGVGRGPGGGLPAQYP